MEVINLPIHSQYIASCVHTWHTECLVRKDWTGMAGKVSVMSQ